MLQQNTDFTKVSLNKVVHVLLEIQTPTPIYLVDDNSDFIFKNKTYSRFPFSMNGISESSKGEIPRISISISNVTNLITDILEQGIDDAPVILRIVREGESEADLEFRFIAESVSYDADNITLSLTAPMSYTRSYPSMKYSTVCPFEFKGWRCRYSGSQTKCNKTAKQCREFGNYARFGGFQN